MKLSHRLENLPVIENAKVAVIQSKWYREYTDVMIAKCREVLLAAKAVPPDVHIVSGSLEIPLTAQRLCRMKKGYEAIIAIGIIVKGETLHFEMIANECMRGIGQVMLEEDMPIINEILPVLDIEHAKARASDDEFNKGIEAGIACVETIAWRRRNKIP